MAVSAEYKAFVAELFEGLGPVKIRSMFGGAGIFACLEQGDLMFGLIANESVYLKVSDANKPDYEAEGLGPFVYGGKDKPMAMSYYEMPERLYDDPDELKEWAQRALDVAIKAKTPKKKK